MPAAISPHGPTRTSVADERDLAKNVASSNASEVGGDGFDVEVVRSYMAIAASALSLPVATVNTRAGPERARKLSVVPEAQASGLTMGALQNMPVWAAFNQLQKAQLEALLTGDQRRSKLTRWGLMNETQAPGFAEASPADQVKKIFAALSRTPILPGNVALELSDTLHPPMKYSLGAAELAPAYKFRTKETDADKYRLSVAEHDDHIVIFAPRDLVYSLPNQHTANEVALAVAELPRESRALVQIIRLNPDANPDDASWAKAYGTQGFSSFMSCDANGQLDIYPTRDPNPVKNIMENMNHEAGHVWSLKLWGHDESAAAWNPWREAVAADGLPSSAYGASSLREDVAESTALYLTTRGTPRGEVYRAMYPHRFALLAKHFPGDSVPGVIDHLS